MNKPEVALFKRVLNLLKCGHAMPIPIMKTLIPTSSNPKCLFVAASKLKLKKLEQRSECEEGWREGPIRHSRSENSPSSYLTGGRRESLPPENQFVPLDREGRTSFVPRMRPWQAAGASAIRPQGLDRR